MLNRKSLFLIKQTNMTHSVPKFRQSFIRESNIFLYKFFKLLKLFAIGQNCVISSYTFKNIPNYVPFDSVFVNYLLTNVLMR